MGIWGSDGSFRAKLFGSENAGTSYTSKNGKTESLSRFGNTTYKQDGSSRTDIGSTSYLNNSKMITNIGNTYYASGGKAYQKIGNTLYGNGKTWTAMGERMSDQAIRNIIADEDL